MRERVRCCPCISRQVSAKVRGGSRRSEPLTQGGRLCYLESRGRRAPAIRGRLADVDGVRLSSAPLAMFVVMSSPVRNRSASISHRKKGSSRSGSHCAGCRSKLLANPFLLGHPGRMKQSFTLRTIAPGSITPRANRCRFRG